MAWELRKAVISDRDEIAAVIASSVRGLATEVYTEEQIELSITSVFGAMTTSYAMKLISSPLMVIGSPDAVAGAEERRYSVRATILIAVTPIFWTRCMMRPKYEPSLFTRTTPGKESGARSSTSAKKKPGRTGLRVPR